MSEEKKCSSCDGSGEKPKEFWVRNSDTGKMEYQYTEYIRCNSCGGSGKA